jgi:hypothetical protein
VAINTDPGNPEWFYIKFKQPGSAAVAVANAPAPSASSGVAGATPAPAAETGGGPAAIAVGGWSFVNLRSGYAPDQKRFSVYGEVINNSGSAQKISYLIANLFDDQGRSVTGISDTTEDWPTDLVPPGGQVPFVLTGNDIPGFAEVRLKVFAQPSSQTTRQDFEFLEVEPYDDGIDYCVAGKLRNPGDSLGSYLVITLVLYDDQGDVINFDSGTWYPQQVAGDETLDFEVCADPLNQSVADYDVRAWGQ